MVDVILKIPSGDKTAFLAYLASKSVTWSEGGKPEDDCGETSTPIIIDENGHQYLSARLTYDGASKLMVNTDYIVKRSDVDADMTYTITLPGGSTQDVGSISGTVAFTPPQLVISFDDGNSSDYDAFTYMETKGIKGTSFICTGIVGDDGYLSMQELTEMYAVGWDISSHTHTHTNLTEISESELTIEITTSLQWLLNNSFSRSAKYLAYPWGANDGITILVNSLGVIAARTTHPSMLSRTGPLDSMQYPGGFSLSSSITLQDAIDYIDIIIASGNDSFIYTHQLVADNPTGTQWKLSDFQSLIDYISTKETNNMIITSTFSEFVGRSV